jgi:opine dehydrogenase
MNTSSVVTIIGGGNGAFAAAADLSSHGHLVNLCDPYRAGESLKPIMTERRLRYTGVMGEGEVTLNRVTAKLEEALEGTEFILICVPTSIHSTIANWLAPFLRENTTILLDPGHTGGALHFKHSLAEAGYMGRLILGETNTLTYIARKSNPETINISNVAGNVYISSLPSLNLNVLLEKTCRYFPDLQPQTSIIGTSLRNVNAIMHPPGMILAAVWVETAGGKWDFYYDAATPAVERLMQAIDDERMKIAAAWDVKLEPLIDMLAKIGTTTEEARQSRSLQKAFLESVPNRYIKAPPSLDDRYMHEDIGYGLVPMVTLGNIAGVSAPVMESLITIASTINQIDYRVTGLNAARMGLEGKSLTAIRNYFSQGWG